MDEQSKIIDEMRAAGCGGIKGGIIIDDKKHRFKPDGDKKPNGEYCFKQNPDGTIIGWFKNYKEGGITHKYISKRNREFTPEEKAEFKKRMERERAERDARLREDRQKAAEKAAKIWDSAKKSLEHDYLKKKGICSTGSRVGGDSLIVPAWKEGKLSTLQFIKPDGSKKFLKNGDIKGAYGSVGKDTSVIYISEGFATAKSIYKATGKASIWAFNAENLGAVARIIRKKYPQNDIIICADNDQWTEINEELINVGIEKATLAAKAINAKIVWPDFPESDEQKRTDFNDYDTLQDIKNRIALADYPASAGGGTPVDVVVDNSLAAPSLPPEPVQDNEAWKDQLICNSHGIVQKGSLKNTILFLQNLPELRGVFRYDEFSHEEIVYRCPPWERHETFTAHKVNDIDISECAACLEDRGMTPDRTRIHNAIGVVSLKNRINPAKEYFNALEWDGVPRLSTWLTHYVGANKSDHPDYLAFIGKKWLTAAVKRVFVPGCKFDHVLVIEGKQGAGKSMLLKALATFGEDIEESYVTDAITIADIQNKDTIHKIQGSIIVELAELAGFNKRDDEEIKRWITLQHDEMRVAYARTTTRFERQFVLSATTNSYDYLKDPTGNRRYWPFKAGYIDLDAIKQDRAQLWAEAVHYYKEGMDVWPDPKEAALAKQAQDKRVSEDVWENDVQSAIDGLGLMRQDGFRTDDIMKGMGLTLKDRDVRASRRITVCLQHLGYENKSKWLNGRTTRVWVKEDVND